MRDNKIKEKFCKAVFDVEIPHLSKIIGDIGQLEEDEKNGIQRYPRNNKDIIYKRKKTLVTGLRNVLDIQYSSDNIKISFEELFNMFVKYTLELNMKDIGYIVFLRFFCLGILLDLDKENLRPLVDKLDNESYDDILLSYLAEGYGLRRKYMSTMYHREIPYEKAGIICESAQYDRQRAAEMLVEYMDDYLDAHSDIGWDKAAKEWAAYYGIWSYEAAAISKLFNIDDKSLKNHSNYPFDLAHFKEEGKTAHKIEIIKSKKEELSVNISTEGIPVNRELEKVIPAIYHEELNELISDYDHLSDKEFWKKYKLKDIWYKVDEYISEKNKGMILGKLIVFYLTEKGYILQLDYKEDFEDYEAQIKNYWGDNIQIKTICFALNNDQQYFALIPKETKIENVYEVSIRTM